MSIGRLFAGEFVLGAIVNAVIVMISGLAVAAAALQALIGSSLHILLGQSMTASCAACAHRRKQACPMTLYQACLKV